jgi:hypothetical protein
MLTNLVLMIALAATPVQAPQAAPPAKPPAVRFSRMNCTLNYYHFKIISLHVAGGYALNLPLTVFIEDEAAPDTTARHGDAVAQQSVFSMPLLHGVTIGYQGRDKAFFISWLRRFQRPRVQLYFKLWM